MSHLDRLKLPHLRLMARLAETGQISRAAEGLRITQPAASRLLVEIGQAVGHPVHVRAGRGIALTAIGQALAARARRLLLDLDDIGAELEAIAAGGVGHVRLGAVTAPAMDVVLPLLRIFRMTRPGVSFEVAVAPSASLCADLRAGRLDLAIGRHVTPADAEALDYAALGTEPISLVVRRGHPLDRGAPVALPDLLAYDWLLPGGDSPLAAAVRLSLAERGARLPRPHLTTASFLMTLVLLRQTNAIAPLARAAIRAFADPTDADYVELSSPLAIDAGPYGLLTRKGQALTPAAAQLAAMIRDRAGAAAAG